MDADGFPKIRYADGQFYYNPVQSGQQALAEYSREGGPTPMFLKAVDKLITMQDHRGAFLYPFRFEKYATGEVYEPGWTSGMAQGHALSALARAFHVTKEPKYLAAGNAALDFMMLPRDEGGVLVTRADLHPSLSNYIFIMEYPQTPAVYTLNGYMFAMLGLYDWHALTGSSEAKALFDETMRTLVKILPYYDLGNFSCYDLSYITVPITPEGERRTPHTNPAYHSVHIEELWALYAGKGAGPERIRRPVDVLRRGALVWSGACWRERPQKLKLAAN